MTKIKTDKTKQLKEENKRQRKLAEEERMKQEMLKHEQAKGAKPGRKVDLENEDDFEKINQTYQAFVQEYKKTNPDFNETKNKIKVDKKNNAVNLQFSDPKAEEAFLRNIAQKAIKGSVFDKGIKIAEFKDGQLIDPRTNEEFPDGGYAELVKQLDSGKEYGTIVQPESKKVSGPGAK